MGMHFPVVRTWAVGLSFLAASLQTGCTLSPATQRNGLPRISRYTNALQLDWALSRYAEIAAHAPDPHSDTVRQACQGWQRMTYDLASARYFPRAFRMSAETAGLMAAIDELPAAVARHPLPAACVASGGSASSPFPAVRATLATSASTSTTVATASEPQPPAVPTPDTPAASAQAQAQATTAPQGSSSAEAQAPASVAPPTHAAPASPIPAAPVAISVAVVAPTEPSLAAGEDAESSEWRRLRSASALPFNDLATQPATMTQPDLRELAALAESAVPAVRLRARFHLLGHCAIAVAQEDRLGKAAATSQPACWGNHGQEPLRVTQGRLLRSMLSTWRGRGPEPLSDLVVALASFASRDNPVLDGPRISR